MSGPGGARLGRGLPRPVEAALALAGLAATSPLIAAGALAVLVTSGRPAFFRQLRVGRGGRTFRLVKLRSMRNANEGLRVTARGDDRVTPIGRVLRRTKLDELPELWNVLRGDMSFVGPRPEVPEYVDLGDPMWAEVLQVRPGLTDPVTLALRDEEELIEAVEGNRERYYRETLQPQKLAGYCRYLKTRTWRRDVVVIWNTIMALLTRNPTSDQGPDLPDRPGNA